MNYTPVNESNQSIKLNVNLSNIVNTSNISECNDNEIKPSNQHIETINSFDIFDYSYRAHITTHDHKDLYCRHLSSEIYQKIIPLLMLLFDDLQYFLIQTHPNHDIHQTYNYVMHSLKQLSQEEKNNEIINTLIDLLDPVISTHSHVMILVQTTSYSDILNLIQLSLPNNNYMDYLHTLEMYIHNIEQKHLLYSEKITLHPYLSYTLSIYKRMSFMLRMIVYKDFYDALYNV